ncbi:acetyl-/propionyl-CoA carboxylase subunit alpha [Micromonospora arborensis]|uniref:Acetyl-/propionyl-CoA carboxylase subunit alpha n=1 Tax=Micromonospora arborensis TaxID=2116518 RepID=A0A318NL66_9ACTN|nr:biotin carboxylase N-terminal domain-containing protein [Micromonospora arborensis]PYC71586.1 acetyl-/propionyl-CoA carboxylase subunit alpha [Micromonospora arborensis]
MKRILIANRGEIAVRIARAAADAGLVSLAVYAGADRDAVHAAVADEAYLLAGETVADTYLDRGQLLAVAASANADAVHPGYGFLSEDADFAQAVLDAGLVWIGPPPSAIRQLGDKVSARAIARRAGAPLVAGTLQPISDADEAVGFAREHGLPIAIKAVHGGGGRGLKVVRDLSSIPELFASAVREATAAFGYGECFVERYLDRPRHVETQCLADRHGAVVVVSTRDCTLQRRHQKVVEEAPAPFLTAAQDAELRRASKAILAAAGYVGAGTCEFLVGADGTLSFLEVNTRLQVEHPVSEEVTGIDLVREMFRLADGEAIGYDDPPVRGHAIEFRINGEDPGRGFVPAPGTVACFDPPAGPGVRLDAGVRAGSVVSPVFDSLLAKLVVTGADRQQALQRARRALAEFRVDGVATLLPFHRAVVEDPAFTDSPFRVHTGWIENDFDNRIEPVIPEEPPASPQPRQVVVVEVNGRRVEVAMPAIRPAPTAAAPRPPARRPAGSRPAASSSTTLLSPMQGTVVRLAVAEGDRVQPGQLIAVLEAMKMEQPLPAQRAGTVKDLRVAVGTPVAAGGVVCEITD